MTVARRLVTAGTACLFLGVACNLGPFPDFLERLDPLDPVEGQVKAWILAEEQQTQVLVLSESGRFLHSVIGRDTAVVLETGAFSISGKQLVMQSEVRYEFPQESGAVSNRTGAQSEQINREKRRDALREGERLTIEGWGTFVSTADYVSGLDFSTSTGRGCLLKYIQLSIRTAQSRIRNFGGGGTVIYHNNRSSFSGFLSGEQTIVVENLLSPDTTISSRDFQDFPEVRLDGRIVSHVSTAGDGSLEDSISFRILGATSETGPGGGGAGGAVSSDPSARPVLASGRLVYGPDDAIQIGQGDVVGGSYELVLTTPTSSGDIFPWQFLDDLDLRPCSVFADQ
jgi:hypothetical protein